MAATKGLMDHLFMAASEWFLMFLIFINAAWTYFLTRFAQYCELQIPCLFCLRLDYFFGNKEHVSNLNVICNRHQADISCLISCNLHNKLANVREMCEDCFMLVSTKSQSNSESYRFMVGTMGREREGYQRSYLNKNLVHTCSCCKRQLKTKSSGQRLTKNAIRLGAPKVTTKPPLPHVPRRGRSSRRDSFNRTRDKSKHHSVDALPTIRYSQLTVTSDIESDLPFSDDDLSFRVAGLDERNGSKDDSIIRHSTGSRNRYKIHSRHSYSTSNLGSALLLEMHLDEILTTSSASVEPNCSIGHGLGESLMSKFQNRPGPCSSDLNSLNAMQFPLRKAKESDHLKPEKDKKPLPSMSSVRSDGLGSSDDSAVSRSRGNQNPHIPGHSYSATDLGSAHFLEMHLDKSSTRRSTSLTPNCSIGHGLGGFNWLEFQNRNSPSPSPQLDSSNTLQFPLRKAEQGHPTKAKKPDFSRGLGSSTNYKSDPSTSLDKSERRGSLDDFVASHNTSSQNRSNILTRNSFSASDLGSALLNMHLDESSTRRAASLTPNCSVGLDLGDLNRSKFQIRPRHSHSQELNSQNVVPVPLHNAGEGHPPKPKKNKKPSNDPFKGSTAFNVRSDLSSTFSKIDGKGSLGDSFVSHSTPSQNQSDIFSRNSFSASDLGSTPLLEMHLDDLTKRSASMTPNCSIGHGFGELRRPSPYCSQKIISLNVEQVPLRNAEKCHPPKGKRKKKSSPSKSSVKGSQSQSKIGARHSYSASDLGSALMEMHQNKSLKRRSASLTPNFLQFTLQNAEGHPRKAKKKKSTNSVKGIHARHSYSASDLGSALLLEMQNESLRRRSASLTPNFLQFTLQNAEGHPQKAKKKKKSSSSTSSVKGTHARHSYGASDLGSALLLEMQNESLRRRSASLTPNFLQFTLQNAEGHARKAKKKNTSSSSTSSVKGLGSSVNVRSDLSSTPFDKADGYRSFDDPVISHSTGHQNRSTIPARHSYSASDLRSALLQEMYLNENLRRRSASLTPNCSIGQGMGELNWSKFQTRPSACSQELNSHNFVQFPLQNAQEGHPPKAKKKKSLSSTNGHGSFDDSVVSHNTGSQNRSKIHGRHSYSASDLGSALFLEMQLNKSLRRRSASLTPNCSIGQGLGESNLTKSHTRPRPCSQGFNSLNFVQLASQTAKCHPPKAKKKKSLGKAHGHGSSDDSIISCNMGSQNRYKIFTRHSYSASDLGSAFLLEMHLDERLTRRSASLTPNFSIGNSFQELNWSKFQTNPSHSHSEELSSHNAMQFPYRNAKDGHPPKAKRRKIPLPPTDSVKHLVSSGNVTSDLLNASLNKTYGRGSFDDSVVSLRTGNENQHKILPRNSYSASDLRSELFLEMHLDDILKSSSTSLTPNCSIGHGLGESSWSKLQTRPSSSCSKDPGSLNPKEAKKNKDPLPPTNTTRGSSSSANVKSHLSSASLDNTDGHGSQNRFKIFARNSFSADDLGSVFLQDMHFDESLRRRSTSLTPNRSIGHGFEELNWSKEDRRPKCKKNKRSSPSTNFVQSSSANVRSDLSSDSLYKNKRHGSFDDSVVSRNMGDQNCHKILTRHAYSASDLGSALLLEMLLDERLASRSTSLTPTFSVGDSLGEWDRSNFDPRLFPSRKAKGCHPPKAKKNKKASPSTNFVNDSGSSSTLHKTDGHESFDDHVVSSYTGSQNRHKTHVRHSCSASDLGSALLLEMYNDSTLKRRSTSLTPICSITHGLGEPNRSNSTRPGPCSSQDLGSLNTAAGHPPKPKKNKKPLSSKDFVKGLGSDLSSAFSDQTNQNQDPIVRRHSYSASDLGSALLLQMHLDKSSTKKRSASLTPDFSFRHGMGESSQSTVKTKEGDPLKTEKHNNPLPPTYPTKEMDSSSNTLDKTDGRASLDGSSVSEIEGEGVVEKLKRQMEHDRRCLSLLQSELEAERSAAAIAANQAMTMITRLQQEKASLQMEALQYLRMMEEQAEYDMEALEKAKELVNEKDNEIQDLLAELELYKTKYGDEITTGNDSTETENVDANSSSASTPVKDQKP